jgi:HAD superfamily hydrolase (TIGR01458 family)
MNAILFDLDGVLYVGSQPIAGAAQTVNWCVASGIPHMFITNTTLKPRSAIAAKLAGFGINVSEDRILTPPVMAVQWLRENHLDRLGLFVAGITRQEFSGFTHVDEDNAAVDAVVVGDMGAGWDFATLNRAFRMLMQQPSPYLVALGLTRYWLAEDGLRLDAGAYVAALQYACGGEPVVMGKPSGLFYRSALRQLGVKPEQAYMVGDDIKSDIDGAQRAGMKGILVSTGKFHESDLNKGIKPAAVINSVAELPAWWESNAT